MPACSIPREKLEDVRPGSGGGSARSPPMTRAGSCNVTARGADVGLRHCARHRSVGWVASDATVNAGRPHQESLERAKPCPPHRAAW
jgi:hypothetical protein